MSSGREDYDGAWKEALELYLQSFLELCFLSVAREIDWSKPVEFLDKELQEVVRDSELGKQRVDKLVKVWRLDGAEEWVLIHVEVQGQFDEGLPRRVYQYHHRMPYVTSIERLGREEGRQEGRQEGRLATLREGILDILETRFGSVEKTLREKIESTQEEQRLKELHRKAIVATDIQTFSRELG